MSDIHFILTGGTIDSLYNPITEKAEPAAQSCIPDYLQNAIRPYENISFETVCMLDSGDITDELRGAILDAVIKAPAKRIIVAHGTNTMTKTLEFLDKKSGDKTVVLIGAMIPLKQFVLSDGGFNLGYAMAQVQSLDPGVYICMHGRTFLAGAVQKNFEKARFENT